MVSNDSKLPNSARNAKKKFFVGGGKRRRTAGAAVPPPFSLFKYFLLTSLKRFCFNIFKITGELLYLRYTLINDNLKKTAADGGSGGPAAVFFKVIKTWGN